LVLECILSPKCARKQPYKLLPITMLFYSTGILVYIAIPGLMGSPLIFTLLPFLPLMFRMLMWEEKEEEAALRRHESSFFEYHKILLESYAYIFIGAIFASMIWYGVLLQISPAAAHSAFSNEVNEISAIGNTVSQATSATGNFLNPGMFSLVLGHNLQVLFLMLLFSVLYGVGSLYLLLWNASVIGVFVATQVVKGGIAIHGILDVAYLILSVFGAFFGILPHGIFELSAYFVASIAGGIFSLAVMRRHLERPELKKVLVDSSILVLVSIALLLIGATIESCY
jgi:uncharacterized membrane protein SpoIIM required for sporulation